MGWRQPDGTATARAAFDARRRRRTRPRSCWYGRPTGRVANPVLLAHQAATIDQISDGRLVLGVGIARDVPSIRAEFQAAGVPFERRVGRMMEGLRLAKALWSGQPVDWSGFWRVDKQMIGPTPHRAGGPPLWIAGSLPQSLERAGTFFDGWLPNSGDAAQWGQQWQEVGRIARGAGRDPAALTGSMYLTLSIDEDIRAANERLDTYLEQMLRRARRGAAQTAGVFRGPVRGGYYLPQRLCESRDAASGAALRRRPQPAHRHDCAHSVADFRRRSQKTKPPGTVGARRLVEPWARRSERRITCPCGPSGRWRRR